MPFDNAFVPSPAGVTLAAAAVVIGAPIFSQGLKALRLRRALARLRDARIADLPEGLVRLRGRVGLESPLFGPLSGKRCAGYRLEAHAVEMPLSQSVGEQRAFRLVADGVTAHVAAEQGTWTLPTTAENEFGPDDPLPGLVGRLLERMPEAVWARRTGRRLRLVERALLSGMSCSVLGHASLVRVAATRTAEVVEWMRTGTDDQAIAVDADIIGQSSGPVLHVGPDEAAGPVRVSDQDIEPGTAGRSPWGAIGVLAGPGLAVSGLLYLAAAADYWRAMKAYSG